jgi:hypothetical protein
MEEKIHYDCTNYDSKGCPKAMTLKYQIQSNEDFVNFLQVSCWGNFCWEGYRDVYSWKEVEDENELFDKTLKKKSDISDEKLKELDINEKKELLKSIGINILDFFEKETDLYGQKWVVNGMEKYSNKYKTEALFLAGDNVYAYDIPKEKLLKMVSEGKYPSKKKYKSDSSISPQDIKKQLSLGFTNCLNKINVNNFFIALGNHDIQTCEDLNEQLNYGNRYDLKGTYYNVIYDVVNKENNYRINFIVIDTNLFPEKLGEYEKSCNGDKYTSEQLNRHVEWIMNVIEEGKSDWNIIIGHVPYKANGHKEKNKTIFNESLNELFDKISERELKVQVYMCGDSHNQQFLKDDDHKLSLVICGSGGTALDYNIQNSEKYVNDTLYVNACFGFVSMSFDKDILNINYYKTTEDQIENTFSYVVTN